MWLPKVAARLIVADRLERQLAVRRFQALSR